MKKDVKLSLLFAVIGLVSGALLAMFQLSVAEDEFRRQIIAQLGSAELLIVVSAVQAAVIGFVCSFIGLKLARRADLKLNFKFRKESFYLAAAVGLSAALLISASDRFLFAAYLPAPTGPYEVSFIQLLASVLYGGIIEEVMLRLFMMSLLVLILWKVFARSKDRFSIPAWIYHTAVFLAALLFAAGHLPATAQLLGLSAPILIRNFLLNGAGGIGFGYLYWKKGLAYAMAGHALAHVFNQLIFLPLFF